MGVEVAPTNGSMNVLNYACFHLCDTSKTEFNCPIKLDVDIYFSVLLKLDIDVYFSVLFHLPVVFLLLCIAMSIEWITKIERKEPTVTFLRSQPF